MLSVISQTVALHMSISAEACAQDKLEEKLRQMGIRRKWEAITNKLMAIVEKQQHENEEEEEVNSTCEILL